MDIYTPSIDVQKWFPDKSDLTKWVYDIIKYLHDTPIPTEEDVAKAVDAYLAENPITGNFYSADNPPPYPVTSINGETGAITGVYTTKNPQPIPIPPVKSVNGRTGAVTGLYDADNPPPYPVTSVNGKTGDVTGLYSADNKPPYPVKSVNGKTGAVTGLYDANHQPPYPVTSVNGKTGAVEISSSGMSVSARNNITVTNVSTDIVTLTLSGYTPNKYKIIYVYFECHSQNKDAGIMLKTDNNYYLYSGVSDFDGAQYDSSVKACVSYPVDIYDGATLKLQASDGGAQIYTDTNNYWWGVE